MLFLTPILVVASVPQAPTYRVVEVHRDAIFAGRLGKRIEDRLIVTSDGERYEVLVGRRHTAIHPVPELHVGDEIRIAARLGSRANRVLPEQVRLLRT
jgi:hypothetical protein